MVDEILLNETQKIIATNHEAPEILDSDYDKNDLYQVDKMKKIDWLKHAFEYEQKKSYGIQNWNDMMRIQNNEVNNIAECNLLHDIINPPKRDKILNSQYSPIVQRCMNTGNGRARFKNFHILLDSGFSSTIVMGRLVEKYF